MQIAPPMDLTPATWIDRCAAELARLWPGLSLDDAMDAARSLGSKLSLQNANPRDFS